MDDDDRREALDALGDALQWQLPATRWRAVEAAVHTMVEALARDDPDAFRRAESDLDMAGPVRARSAEDPPKDPVPVPLRERINELIHTLDASAPDTDGSATAG